MSLCKCDIIGALAVLGDCHSLSLSINSGGSLSYGSTVTAAREVVLALKVEILKLDDEVIDGCEGIAALTGEGEYARV